MKISDYFYVVGDEDLGDRVGLLGDRSTYMNADYTKMFRGRLEGLDLEGRVAVLYAGGVGMHIAESRVYKGGFECSVELQDDGPAIKRVQAYMMHRYIGLMPCRDKVEYASINGNTCASSMYSVYEAQRLVDSEGFDHVVVITEEKTNFDTIRTFHEHNIKVKPGEGFACVVFSKEGKFTVRDSKWAFKYNRNPFLVSKEGYELVKSEADLVKGHQTGTEQNDASESAVFGEVVGYKNKIGHCQGASGLIELCMVLDDDSMQGSVLCVASGLGGFYGSCVVEK